MAEDARRGRRGKMCAQDERCSRGRSARGGHAAAAASQRSTAARWGSRGGAVRVRSSRPFTLPSPVHLAEPACPPR
eukprot:scaffold7132_cov202-Prasinococcus_capsulatus_cf.AAC.1